jgi:type VI secretion system secreted protein Hcp
MAFDAFCYFPNSGVEGETQDKAMKANKAFEILNFAIGAENNINIGSISAGGGAGKATFKELNITKKTDSASCALFSKLCEGNHFDDMTIELRRSGGQAGVSGTTFLKWEFKLVMVQDIGWSGSDGDDICEESLVLQYGAMKVTYTAQDAKGKAGTESSGEWSRVLNQASLAVS